MSNFDCIYVFVNNLTDFSCWINAVLDILLNKLDLLLVDWYEHIFNLKIILMHNFVLY